MAVGDLVGQAVFSTLTIIDQDSRPRQIKPNRKIIPSRWVVTDPGQSIAMQFDQKILGKMVNPINNTMLALLDNMAKEVYRLIVAEGGSAHCQ